MTIGPRIKSEVEPLTKRCKYCGDTKAARLFVVSSLKCIACKNKQTRERKQAARGLKSRSYTRPID